MPHFGLMNADTLGPSRAALQRARLHIRGGKRRLRQGKISAGIVTLYDALECALEWYVSSPSRSGPLGLREVEKRNSAAIYRRLVKLGTLGGSFDFVAFDSLVERALGEELPEGAHGNLLEGLETVMRELGVMPFDEGMLPPESPQTF